MINSQSLDIMFLLLNQAGDIGDRFAAYEMAPYSLTFTTFDQSPKGPIAIKDSHSLE